MMQVFSFFSLFILFFAAMTATAQTVAHQQALESIELNKKGLPNLALEKFFSIKDYSTLGADLKKQIAENFPPQHPAWKTAKIKWQPATINIFRGIYGSQSLPFPVYAVGNSKELKTFKKQISERPSDAQQAAWHEHQLALWSAIHSESQSATGLLDGLTANENLSSVDINRVWLNKARVHFQKNEWGEALEAYNQVSKGSDYWLEAVEEKAWTYLRLNQPAKTLGQLKTLFAPIFATQVGPEPYFLAALTNLKICDYSTIFSNIELFKKNFKGRVDHIQKLAEVGSTKAAQDAVEKLARGPYHLRTIAKELPYLPRLFHRDEFVRRNIERYQAYRKEAAKASIIMAETAEGESLKKQADKVADEARNDIFMRLKYLAEAEVAEIRRIIQKLHIVEAEVIQRMYRDEKLADKKRKERGEKIVKTADVLVFPVSNEVWLDELDSYHVRVKDCPAIGGKTL